MAVADWASAAHSEQAASQLVEASAAPPAQPMDECIEVPAPGAPPLSAPPGAPLPGVLGPSIPATSPVAAVAAPEAKTRSPYFEFCQEQRPLLLLGLANAEREKLLSKLWKALSELEKARYSAGGGAAF